MREFRVAPESIGELKVGSELKVDMFQPGMKVDVSGTTHGKGFAGVIKRYHFSSNRASHGNSLSHNSAGSIGMATALGYAGGGLTRSVSFFPVCALASGADVAAESDRPHATSSFSIGAPSGSSCTNVRSTRPWR